MRAYYWNPTGTTLQIRNVIDDGAYTYTSTYGVGMDAETALKFWAVSSDPEQAATTTADTTLCSITTAIKGGKLFATGTGTAEDITCEPGTYPVTDDGTGITGTLYYCAAWWVGVHGHA